MLRTKGTARGSFRFAGAHFSMQPDLGEGPVANDCEWRQAKLDPRKSKLVELRFFGGLSVEETAAILKVSPFTVIRDWTFAKVWLHREMSAE